MSEYIACITSAQVVLEYYCYIYKIVNAVCTFLSSPLTNLTTHNASLSNTFNKYFRSRDFQITKVEQEKLRNAVNALPLVTSEFMTPELQEICYHTFRGILDEMLEKWGVIDEVTKKFDELMHSFHDIRKENIEEKENYERQNCIGQRADFTNSFGKGRFINLGTANRPNTEKPISTEEEQVAEKPISLEVDNVVEKTTSSEAKNADSVTSLSAMQIASVVADINSSLTLAEQDSYTFGVHTVEEKRLG
ncbi:hypothetical protein M9H77_13742 [Catharanthus roseus]|uniref:Uncharacterized protein n=1 Tax=Catharanthus roseus TaxID=4058 RepID=A0ACC0BLA0_CATRO|nr:hypothetical protein M9H77_13742 [Catharanthus roseus]